MGNNTGKTPLWQAIAASLRDDIAEGRYGPGDKMPGELALAERFGVNRHTVRHALTLLKEEGLVHSRRGSGVYVLARPMDYPLGRRVRFRRNLLAAGRLPELRILGIESREATAEEAAPLALAQGDMICVSHGYSLADAQPVSLSESLFPQTRLPGIAEALREGKGVTHALQQAGVADYTRASTRISARLATATQALHLRLREGAPLIYATSINVDPDGKPVEFGRTWFAGDRITLTLENDGLA
ncbi:phosphonate metabolism transcriptional regulator PhnF [Paracoccus onubensis]|uniref:phosphonate metabolism transcriptional regulator PhnF n=1 Tax=Paracoccus onubensis TaxID=1675788 RepID=UPI0027303897|nr:phosphonate metabolism transcriptional regulator PhnF [Paracoccus onubensis]MDP0927832.1 phosphonate metabolism transcriptional regulator PhnF [Paracoccus onubensis]